MKKLFLVLATGIAATLSVHAQNTPLNANAAKLERLQTLAPVKGSLSSDNKNLIKIKALRDFSKTFETVTNEDWYIIKNGFMAKFKQAEIQYRVIYGKGGNLIATFRYYTEEQLPQEVRSMVKSTWCNCTISQITEVSFGGKTAYLVNIEDEKSLKTIKVVNDEMEVYQEIIKG
jgi:hypothetical protein